MAAPQLPVNFDLGFLRGGGRSCSVKNDSLGFDTEFVFFDDYFIILAVP